MSTRRPVDFTPFSLECSHCGYPAIESDENFFWDGDGEKCGSCGFPGSVSADGETAYWRADDNDDACCDLNDCSLCGVIHSVRVYDPRRG